MSFVLFDTKKIILVRALICFLCFLLLFIFFPYFISED